MKTKVIALILRGQNIGAMMQLVMMYIHQREDRKINMIFNGDLDKLSSLYGVANKWFSDKFELTYLYDKNKKLINSGFLWDQIFMILEQSTKIFILQEIGQFLINSHNMFHQPIHNIKVHRHHYIQFSTSFI